MKKILITLIVTTQSVFLFSQDKKHKYYDNDSNNNLYEISESQYLSLKNDLSYPLIYENDSIKVSILSKINITSKLNESTLDYFKINYSLDKNNFTVINYIDNDPRKVSKSYQVPWSIFEGDFIKEMNKIEKISHFWVINPNVTNLYYYHGNKINWQKDTDNYIQKNFLFFEGFNGGYIILDPKGNFYLHRGEYSKEDFLKQLKELKRKSFKS
ncbi:hypothetical protein [Flavobacterium sp. A45]|uniref:hypothetical protein n=1 Tax=Flavobacterium sp. A45 TaxID=1945862 RepID=UPI000986B712|nr:hypothetical protein [Flavobacterium sp. A45]OOG71047.1 hypothetical protein B0E44_10485 [Flavobacterium sp. A45]